MREIAKALSSIKDERYRRCFLARLVYEQYSENPVKITDAELILSNARMDKIAVTALDLANHLCVRLEATLLFGSGRPGAAAAKPVGAREWHCFSAAEIKEFVQAAGDMNEIHGGKTPVVPGMLILQYLQQDFNYKEISLKFIAPVYGGEMIYLAAAADGFAGYSEKQCIFKGKGRI